MTIVNIKQQVQTDECQRAGLSACKFEGNGGDSRELKSKTMMVLFPLTCSNNGALRPLLALLCA